LDVLLFHWVSTQSWGQTLRFVWKNWARKTSKRYFSPPHLRASPVPPFATAHTSQRRIRWDPQVDWWANQTRFRNKVGCEQSNGIHLDTWISMSENKQTDFESSTGYGDPTSNGIFFFWNGPYIQDKRIGHNDWRPRSSPHISYLDKKIQVLNIANLC